MKGQNSLGAEMILKKTFLLCRINYDVRTAGPDRLLSRSIVQFTH